MWADRAAKTVSFGCAALVVLLILAILGFLAYHGAGTFRSLGLREVFLGLEWSPGANRFGILPFLLGSLIVVGMAVLIAGPMGILTAVFIAKLAPRWMRGVMRQVMDLLVGIPSVVYGIFGLSVLLPFLSRTFLDDAPAAGFLPAALLLTVMIVPTIVSLSLDAFLALPASLDEGSLALGSTRWQSIWQVLIPAAWPRLVTAVVLGMGRALGEAMAVQMVIGNNPQWTALLGTREGGLLHRLFFTPAATMTTELVQDLPNTPAGSPWNQVLFTLGLLLYLVTAALILLTRRLGRARMETA